MKKIFLLIMTTFLISGPVFSQDLSFIKCNEIGGGDTIEFNFKEFFQDAPFLSVLVTLSSGLNEVIRDTWEYKERTIETFPPQQNINFFPLDPDRDGVEKFAMDISLHNENKGDGTLYYTSKKETNFSCKITYEPITDPTFSGIVTCTPEMVGLTVTVDSCGNTCTCVGENLTSCTEMYCEEDPGRN